MPRHLLTMHFMKNSIAVSTSSRCSFTRTITWEKCWLNSAVADGIQPASFPPRMPSAEMMTQMTVNGADSTNGHDPRTRSIMDPCCGTGRMLLHASNYSLNLYGMDIDPLVLTITKINGALYCPWLAFPIPSHILKIDPGTENEETSNIPLLKAAPEVSAATITSTRQISS